MAVRILPRTDGGSSEESSTVSVRALPALRQSNSKEKEAGCLRDLLRATTSCRAQCRPGWAVSEMPPETVSLRSAAARLGVHPATLRRWIAAGHVPGAVRTPTGYVRVPIAVLSTLLRPISS